MNFNIDTSKFEKIVKEKYGTERNMFINMIRIVYPDKDAEKYYATNKVNLSAAKNNNKRSFKQNEILCLEKLLNVPFISLLEDSNTKTNFFPDGTRYVAYLDEIEGYERLNNINGDSNSVILNYDEFDKNIFQYILEYNSINGLSYLINKRIVTLDVSWYNFLFNGGLYYSKKEALATNKSVINMLINNKIGEFNTLFQMTDLITKSRNNELGMLKNEEIIKNLLSNEKFLKEVLICSKFKLNKVNYGFQSDKDGYFVNPLITILINYGLTHFDKFSNTTISLLKLGIELNRKVINYFKMDVPEKFKYARLDDSGLILDGRTIVGSVANYVIKSPVDLSNEANSLLQKLEAGLEEIVFSAKNLTGGFSSQETRIQNGKLIKMHSNNVIEYEFLNYMESVGYNKVPKIIEINKNGKDVFTYIPGSAAKYVFEMSKEEIKEVILELKKINTFSKEKLNNELVYVHGDLSPQNVVFKDKKIVGIIDWDGCYLGHLYYDFIYVFWTWCNVGSYVRNNENLFNNLKEMLEIYEADSLFKKRFC